MFHRIQSLKAKAKMEIHQNINDYYDQMINMGQSRKFKFEEGPFSKKTQGLAFIIQEVLLKKKLELKIWKY